MIDYKTFFEELRDCYKQYSIDFDYDLGRVHFTNNNQNKTYYPKYKLNSQGYYQNYSSKNSKNITTSQDVKKKYPITIHTPTASVKVFESFEAMCYKIALNLSEKIGRLPDHLHARMVLSIDNNEDLKTYIRKFC